MHLTYSMLHATVVIHNALRYRDFSIMTHVFKQNLSTVLKDDTFPFIVALEVKLELLKSNKLLSLLTYNMLLFFQTK